MAVHEALLKSSEERETARLRTLVEDGSVEDARSLVKELEVRWPDSEPIRAWARVLAPPRVIGTRPASGRTLARERDWLRRHARGYPGCWLALDGDRLVAADASVETVIQVAELEGVVDPLLHFVPPRGHFPC